MKQVWQANDGTIFESKEECQEYENSKIQAWGLWGSNDIRKVNDVGDASIVYVPDSTYITHEMEDEGIDGEGVWVWNEWRMKYTYWGEIADVYDQYKGFIYERTAEEKEEKNLDIIDEYGVRA